MIQEVEDFSLEDIEDFEESRGWQQLQFFIQEQIAGQLDILKSAHDVEVMRTCQGIIRGLESVQEWPDSEKSYLEGEPIEEGPENEGEVDNA